MGTRTSPSDEELLSSHDTQAFGIFYDRHAQDLLGYFARRTGDPQVAADLTAETFASAIVAQRRYVPTGAPALAWLYAIAARRLVDYQRRGAVERRTQRALAMERVTVGEEDAAMIRLLADDAALTMLAQLPPDQRDAVTAHVVDDRDYPELAASLDTSEAAVRQRVSRAVAVVIGVRSVPPPEPSSEPRVVEVVKLGGIPVDGVLAGGALWVADSGRSEVVRIDPATRRVVARIRMTGNVADIAAGEDGLWVRAGGKFDRDDSRLSRIDPRSNRVVAGFAAAPGWPLAVAGGALWADRRWVRPEGIARIDAGSGKVTRQIPLRDTDGLAAASGVVWAILQNGTVARIDAASGRITRRWPVLAPSAFTADANKSIAPDAGGAWVLGTGEAAIFRLEGDRVTRRLAIDSTAQPILVKTRDGLWIAAGNEVRGRHRVERIDPVSGKETASVDLGVHRPRALVPVAGGLWVIAGDGTALLIKA